MTLNKHYDLLQFWALFVLPKGPHVLCPLVKVIINHHHTLNSKREYKHKKERLNAQILPMGYYM